MLTAIAGIFGIGGGILGAKAARRLKHAHLEELSEQYSRQAILVSNQTSIVEGEGRQRLNEIYAEFARRRDTATRELEKEWMGEIKIICKTRDQQRRKFNAEVKVEISALIDNCRERLEMIANMRRIRWFAWWPTSSNVALYTEQRLRVQALEVLKKTGMQFGAANDEDFRSIWSIIENAVREDPLSTMGPLLVRRLNEERVHTTAVEAATRKHRAIGSSVYDRLKNQMQGRVDQVLSTVNSKLAPIFESLHKFEMELRNEAAALGAKFQ
jgi:hypothetical protein